MKVLINYKITKEKFEEFAIIQVLDRGDIFVDLPLAIAEFGVHYEKPVLFGDYKGIPKIMELEEVKESIKDMEVFNLKIVGERLIEAEKEESDITIRLPKNTKIDELIYENGQLVWAKPYVEGVE